MSIFDPESLLFQTDWRPLEEYMRRRGEESGLGYAYTEVIPLEAPDKYFEKLAGDLAYVAAQQISEIYKKSIDE